MESKKKLRSNKRQIEYLCHFMNANRDFAAGELKTPHGAAQIQQKWVQLQSALHELGPPRTVDQWKICWRDQKRKARSEGGALGKIKNATGNSGIIPELSENTTLILNTIGKEMALGCGPEESPIGFCPTSFTPATTATVTSLPSTTTSGGPLHPSSTSHCHLAPPPPSYHPPSPPPPSYHPPSPPLPLHHPPSPPPPSRHPPSPPPPSYHPPSPPLPLHHPPSPPPPSRHPPSPPPPSHYPPSPPPLRPTSHQRAKLGGGYRLGYQINF